MKSTEGRSFCPRVSESVAVSSYWTPVYSHNCPQTKIQKGIPFQDLSGTSLYTDPLHQSKVPQRVHTLGIELCIGWFATAIWWRVDCRQRDGRRSSNIVTRTLAKRLPARHLQGFHNFLLILHQGVNNPSLLLPCHAWLKVEYTRFRERKTVVNKKRKEVEPSGDENRWLFEFNALFIERARRHLDQNSLSWKCETLLCVSSTFLN